METISNMASSAQATVSNILYGQPEEADKAAGAKSAAGKEPISGEQGKGTAAQPYDQGNAETPLATPAAVPGSSNSDDFLKLNPTVGKTADTDSSTAAHTTSADTPTPFVPMNPDTAASGTKTDQATTGATGTSGTEWKPTALDEVKTSGAPGAGPTAPDYTPATPDMSSGDKKESAGAAAVTDATAKDTTAKDTTAKDTTAKATTKTEDGTTAKDTGKSSEGHPAKKNNANQEHDLSEIIHPTPAKEHSVPDEEANDPHSKMTGKTVRQPDATKPGAGGEHADDLVKDHAAHKHEDGPSKSSEHEAGEGKDSKMSGLKSKLKNKLHIGSKDK